MIRLLLRWWQIRLKMYHASTSGLFLTVFFSSDISHGVNFDVTGKDDSIEDSSTNDDDFVRWSQRIGGSQVRGFLLWIRRRLIVKSIPSLKKNEKSCTAKDTLDISLTQANKKVRSLKAALRLLKKKLRKADVKMSDFQSEETHLLLSNKTLKKASKKHQKESHRLLFLINEKTQCFFHREEEG